MPPAALLALWQLTDPKRIADTPRATVWLVTRAKGQPAALKLLRPDQTEEDMGARYLAALDGQGAVRVLARQGDAILMEWCDGPSLGDLVRAGKDVKATDTLCDVIQTLHAVRPDHSTLEPLGLRFAPLTSASLDGDLAKAAQIARDLLAAPAPPVALHGDLHHDNILLGARGWLAIDPKGVAGDPAYETANAFRNPEGLGARLCDPVRIARLADQISRRLGYPADRLLGWAAAHCALSTRWSLNDGQSIAEDLRLLPLLLAAAHR